MYVRNSFKVIRGGCAIKNNCNIVILRNMHIFSRRCPSILAKPICLNSNCIYLRGLCSHWFGSRLFFATSCYGKSSLNDNKSMVYVPNRRKAGSGYSNYGHGRYKLDTYQYALCGLGFVTFAVGAILMLFEPDHDAEVKAASINSDNDEIAKADSAENDSEAENEDDKKKKKKKEKEKETFRDRRVIAYEDRIRAYSTPDKIFRYFATLKVYPKGQPQHGPSFEVFMTPDDFVRSISPGVMQPEGLGLEQFAVFDPDKDRQKSRFTLDPDSVFYHLGKYGLISLTDYIFLLTVLSTSARHFALAFKMFDINGDGELDYNEFEMVEAVITKQTTTGLRHREMPSGNMMRHQTSSSMAKFFFGPTLDQKLTIERFLEFQRHLQRDILKIEFKRRNPVDNRISEVSFCQMLLQHSQLADKVQNKMIKRVKKYYRDETKRVGISMVDVEDFFRFLNSINDVDTALTFYHMAGASVDAPTLQHVAASVAGVSIPDHMIEVVFVLFDENQDGELSNREFVNIMKKRLMRGLERPKDTGISRIIGAMWKCAWEHGAEKRAYSVHKR